MSEIMLRLSKSVYTWGWWLVFVIPITTIFTFVRMMIELIQWARIGIIGFCDNVYTLTSFLSRCNYHCLSHPPRVGTGGLRARRARSAPGPTPLSYIETVNLYLLITLDYASHNEAWQPVIVFFYKFPDRDSIGFPRPDSQPPTSGSSIQL